jgi:hypothetical protein
MEKKRHGIRIPGPTEGDPGTAVKLFRVIEKK